MPRNTRLIKLASLVAPVCLALASSTASAQQRVPSQKLPFGGEVVLPGTAYDETADGRKQINDARTLARRENKQVFIIWGENRCGSCYILLDAIQNAPEVLDELRAEYITIKIDVGKFDRQAHLDLARSYGFDVRTAPYVSILDPRTNRTVAHSDSRAFTFARPSLAAYYDPEKILDYLASNRAEQPDAKALYEARLNGAAKLDKQLLVYFSSPRCDTCPPFAEWLASGTTPRIIAKDFVRLDIDVERHTNALEVFNELAPLGTVVDDPFVAIVNPATDGNHQIIAALPIDFADETATANLVSAIDAVKSDITAENIAELTGSLAETADAVNNPPESSDDDDEANRWKIP